MGNTQGGAERGGTPIFESVTIVLQGKSEKDGATGRRKIIEPLRTRRKYREGREGRKKEKLGTQKKVREHLT